MTPLFTATSRARSGCEKMRQSAPPSHARARIIISRSPRRRAPSNNRSLNLSAALQPCFPQGFCATLCPVSQHWLVLSFEPVPSLRPHLPASASRHLPCSSDRDFIALRPPANATPMRQATNQKHFGEFNLRLTLSAQVLGISRSASSADVKKA